MPERAGDDPVERRRWVVERIGVGWVETAMLPHGKYRTFHLDDGLHVFTFDEQQAGWDKEHDLG